MKKLCLILYLITIYSYYFNISITTAKAYNENYMRVLSEDVYIYSDSDFTNKLFEIPYGYYVKVENINGATVKVSYGNNDENYPVIFGYAKLDELTETNTTPTKPFILIKVSATYSDVLFNDYNLSKAYFNVPENTFMIYYGKFKRDNGNDLVYVYCNNKLGYFDVNSLNPFSVPDNPDQIIMQQPPLGEEEKEKEENEKPTTLPAESLQIIIIIGLSVISISIVYYLFKPTKQKTTTEEFFTEEN